MIRFENVSKKYAGAAADAVIDLNLHIREGEICMLVGPSGCGKTTTMKMINKLIEPSAGRIFIDGKNINEIDTIELRLNTGYIIQDIGLFPHMTVAENIATVPNELGWKKEAIRARVDELLDLVDLNPDKYRSKKPRELSGGQKQRVGVARALAANPKIMLMDEPFGALDTITRAKLQDEFLKIQEKIKKTIVFVTHDIDEAIKMGDRIAVLKEGRVVQVGTSMEILLHPADPFVSELLGGKNTLKIMNLIPCGILMTDVNEFMKGSVQKNGNLSDAGKVGMKTTAQAALSEMFRTGESYIFVEDDDCNIRGVVTLDTMMRRVSQYGKSNE
ncbi:MAG: ABC transporter ATP-binding protein [Eubacteriales bacterium]